MTKTVHLVSDATGETIARVGGALISLFSGHQVTQRLHVFIRTEAEADDVIDRIRADPGPVLLTMVDATIRDRITAAATAEGLDVVPVLKPGLEAMQRYLGAAPDPRPGRQYQVDDLYYRRVDAIDFAIGHDDGAKSDRFLNADVILTGVSRTSKTPTCIYLAVRGIKAANLPLIPGTDPPDSFFRAAEAGVPIVALTASPNRLAQIRAHRLEAIGHDKSAEYAALDQIRREVADARLLFERIGAPVIDVSRRSIEETAAAIMAILREKGRL